MRRSFGVPLGLSLAHVPQIVRFLYKLHIALQVPHVFARDANTSSRRFSTLSWRHFDGVARLECHGWTVPAEAPPHDFLGLQAISSLVQTGGILAVRSMIATYR